MALLADDANDRARQLLAITQRLTGFIGADTARMRARLPLSDGPEAEEKARLANLYRQEMLRIGQDPRLMANLAPALKADLRAATQGFQAALSAHEMELSAAKEISEGIIQAVAREASRQRGGPTLYGAQGGAAPIAPARSVMVNRKA